MPRPMLAAGTPAPAAADLTQDAPVLDEGLARVLDALHCTELTDLRWLFSGARDHSTKRQENR